MQLRCCLIDVTIITSRHILYLVYLCPCQRLSLFMSYLLDLYFIFSLIFFAINDIFSFIYAHMFLHIFQNISYYLWMIMWMKKPHNFLIPKVQPQHVVQLLLNFFANFSLVLLTKVLLINKACILVSNLMLLIYCSYANYNQGL